MSVEIKEIEKQVADILENTNICVLATANKGGVINADTMCLINNGTRAYLQTDKNYDKVKNIKDNPNVAITIGNHSFKGVAKVLSHPKNYPWFIEKMKQKHPTTFKQYTMQENEVLIEVEITECKIWGWVSAKDNNSGQMLVADLKNKTSHTVPYAVM